MAKNDESETGVVHVDSTGLLGCFCGGVARVETADESNHRGPRAIAFYAACSDCSMFDHVHSPSKEKAVAHWNYLMQPNDLRDLRGKGCEL